MSELRLITLFIVLSVIVVACVVASVVGITYVMGKAACDDFAKINSDYHFQYTFWNGCLVEVSDGTWISATKMMYVNGKIQLQK